MALRLTSTDLSTRVEGYQTVGGAAMGYFMKIRSERNKMIYLQRLKDANPARLLEYERELINNIRKLEESKSKIANQSAKARMDFILEDRRERGKNFRAKLVANTALTKKGVDVYGQFLDEMRAEENVEVGQAAKVTLQLGLGQSKQPANELLVMKAANRENPGTYTATEIQTKENAIVFQFQNAVSQGAKAAEKLEGGPPMDHFFRWAYLEASQYMKDSGGNEQDLATLRDRMIQGVNKAKYPSQNKDVWVEFLNKRNLREDLLKKQQKYLNIASQSGLNVKELDPKDLDTLFGTSTSRLDTTINKLHDRLDDLKIEREQNKDEYKYLLRGGGMHMGIDPVSYRPSRVGSRMEAMQRMYETEPSLAEATDRSGEVTYGTGAGGNLSEFLKARIGEYRERKTTGADPVQIMNKFVKAVDLYGDNVQDADMRFDVPVMINDQEMASIKEVLESYKAKKASNKNQPPQYQKDLADYYLQELSGDTNLTRDYAGPQRGADRAGDPERARIEEYHSRLYPVRSSVSTVLNAPIEKIISARNDGDKEGIYNAMRELQSIVEDQDLDDLLGSAGTNIRGALGSLHSSAEQIGADAALERTSRHIIKQYEDLAAQRVENDPGLFVAQEEV